MFSLAATTHFICCSTNSWTESDEYVYPSTGDLESTVLRMYHKYIQRTVDSKAPVVIGYDGHGHYNAVNVFVKNDDLHNLFGDKGRFSSNIPVVIARDGNSPSNAIKLDGIGECAITECYKSDVPLVSSHHGLKKLMLSLASDVNAAVQLERYFYLIFRFKLLTHVHADVGS